MYLQKYENYFKIFNDFHFADIRIEEMSEKKKTEKKIL